jgi:hypothetical protein
MTASELNSCLTPGTRSRALRYRCSAPTGETHEPPGEKGKHGDEGDDGGVPCDGIFAEEIERESAEEEVGLSSRKLMNGVAGKGLNDCELRDLHACADLLKAVWSRTMPTEVRLSLRGINQAHPDSSVSR